MLRSKTSVTAVVIVALCACPLLASPVIDGAVGAGEYAYGPIVDVAEPAADFYLSGLDIDEVYGDEDALGGSRYLGVVTTGTPFDVNGSDLSFVQMTGVGLYFYSGAPAPLPSVLINLAFNGLGFIPELSFYREWNGGGWVQTSFTSLTPGAGNDYEVAAADAMELRISKSAFKIYSGDGSSFPSYLRMQLDDTGMQADDQVEGLIPEPAALSLLLLGAAALLRRKRR